MRLICGILRLDGAQAESESLAAMAAAMTRPGLAPTLDTQLDGPLGLGVLDFGGCRHTVFARDRWIMASDARLDRDGSEPGPVFIAALQRHGADFPDRIDGDFAVALWHGGRRELVLGRDFIGVRPLAWTWRPGSYFAFASLPKGLHASGLAAPDIDPVALGCRQRQFYLSGADSGFSAIAYLEAGHSLMVKLDAPMPPRPHRAYRPDPAAVGRWRGTPAEAAATLRCLIEDAVAVRLPVSGSVACHLSGGLDSSAITVLAARAMRRRGGRVRAISLVPPQALGPAEKDQGPLIAAVLAQEPDLDDVAVNDVVTLPGRPHDPDWPGGSLGTHDDEINAAAAAFGADRLLSGVGGDEGASYGGANPYVRLLREGQIRALLRELPARARRDGDPLGRVIRGRLILPLLPQGLRQWVRRLRGDPRVSDSRHGLARFLNPKIVDAVSARCRAPALASNSPEERTGAFADHLIPSRCTYHAIMAARHGLAVSFPLLDRRVVDFVLSLPISAFLVDGQDRQPFRNAMQDILPDPVRLARHKVGLTEHRLQVLAEAKPMLLAVVERLRADTPPAVAEIYNFEAIKEGIAQLPEPDEVQQLVRTRADQRPGARRWQSFAAVQCLIAACHIEQCPIALRLNTQPRR